MLALELPVTVAFEVKPASIVTIFEVAVKFSVDALNVTEVPAAFDKPSAVKIFAVVLPPDTSEIFLPAPF